MLTQGMRGGLIPTGWTSPRRGLAGAISIGLMRSLANGWVAVTTAAPLGSRLY